MTPSRSMTAPSRCSGTRTSASSPASRSAHGRWRSMSSGPQNAQWDPVYTTALTSWLDLPREIEALLFGGEPPIASAYHRQHVERLDAPTRGASDVVSLLKEF